MRTNPTQTLEHIAGLCGVSLSGIPQLPLTKRPSALKISYSDGAHLRHYGVIWAGLTHLTGAPSSISRCPLSQLEAGQLLGTAPGSLLPCLFSFSIRLAQAPSWRGWELRQQAEHAQSLSLYTGSFHHLELMKQVTKSAWGRRHGDLGSVFKFAVVFSPFPLLPILYQGIFTVKIHFEMFFPFSSKSYVSLQDTLCFLTLHISFLPEVTTTQHFVS